MRNMKKLAVMLAVLLLVFTGCGKSDKAPNSDAADALKMFYETEDTATEAAETVLTESADLGMNEMEEESYDGYETEEAYDHYEEYEETEEENREDTDGNVCYISISCETILNHYDLCDPDKWELVPEDGMILYQTEAEFTPGESVFDVLQRVCQENGIHMESEWTPMYNSAYIEGIYNLYEFDVGSDSGWMYQVNGWFPNYGCSKYVVEAGDTIQWQYTCDLGGDIGGSNALG